MNSGLSIFCLDRSESAFGSEDFPGSRWRYQADIVEALAERLYLQQAAHEDAMHLTGHQRTEGKQQSLCLLSSDSAKALCPPASITERAPGLARLRSMLPSCSPSSDVGSALKLAALVANAAGSASITAFIAGPCSVASAGISSLASALAEHQVKIVSLASAAELGKDSAAALQSLIESLNNLSGASPHKMVFLDPPADNLEHWQQLEQVLELIDHQDSQHSSTPPPSPRYHQPPARTPDEGCHDASSAAASSGGHARQPASRVAGCESTRGIRQQSGSCQHKIEAHMWHKNRPLLARRSGAFQSAICRNESLDVLGHLSSDGCMRPWLPSYANLPRAATEAPVYLQHQLCLPSGPKWKVLLDVPAGMMRKTRSQGVCSSAAPSAASKRSDEKLLKDLEACMNDPGRQQAAQSRGLGAALAPVQPPEPSHNSSPAPHTQAGSCCASASGSAAHAGHRRSRGGAQPRRHKPCTARHPLRLEADSRLGRLLLVETRDPRKLLRLIWCPSKPVASSSAPAPSRSHLQQQSIWERNRPAEEISPPEGTLMKLPEHEVKLALDPAAASFSVAHKGQVLVVEQAVAREGQLSQSPKYKGVFRNSTAGEQPMDRCFFWLQGAGAHLHSTGVAQDKLLRTAVEHPELVRAVTPPEGASDNSAEAAEGSMQQERRTQQCTSAAQTALVLHRLVQSVASRAHRKLHSSPACPLLQISGSLQISFEPRGFDSRLGDGGRSSAAWELQHGEGPPPDGPGPLKVSAGQRGRALMEHTLAQCTWSGYCAASGSGHAQTLPASRDRGEQRRRGDNANDILLGQVDLVAAASGEAGTEAGQDCFEDSALYELD